jgi:glycosyltransferase involved in cell wall biosynthesis
LKILVDAFAARQGGGKWFTGSLIAELARQNETWNFLVYCSDPSFVEIISDLPNIVIRLVPEAIGYKARLNWQQVKLRQVIRTDHVDLIFSPMNIGMINPPVPQVTVQRNAHHVVQRVTQRNGGRWFARRTQLLGTLASIKSSRENVFVSRSMLEMTGKWIKEDPNHWHVIHNAVNGDRFLKSTAPVFQGRYFLYVGIITPHKNVDTLINAFAIVSRHFNADVKLVLAGSINQSKFGGFGRWDDYLLKLIREFKLQDNVVFMRSVKGEKLVSLYQHAIACVAPSLLESFGIVPAEALFCDTPCLVSDIPVFREVYGESVAYCDPASTRNMAQAMIRMAEDETIRSKHLNQWQKIKTNFLLSNAAKNYSDVIKKAVALSK